MRRGTRKQTALVVASVILAALIVAAALLLLRAGRVETVVAAISPWYTLLGFVGIVGGLVLYARKLFQWGLRKLQVQVQESTDASRETQSLVETLREELAEEKELRTSERDAREREANRNDQVFAALLESQATSRNFIKWVAAQDLPKRVRELELFAADRETEAHITGQLRLREMTTSPEGNQ